LEVDLPDAHRTMISSLRSNSPAQVLVTFAAVSFVVGLWGLAAPLFANADEPAHAIRAASVARGELVGRTPSSKELNGYTIVRLPSIYKSTIHNCFSRFSENDASCLNLKGSETRTTEMITEAGHHPPAYYAVVGGISRIWPRAAGAVYLMRFTTVLITAFFVTTAVRALLRLAAPRIALVGLAIALTPMVLSFGSAVNPTALETAAAIATWACGLVLVFELRRGRELDAGLVAQLGIAAAAFVLARQISMFWLAFIVAIFVAILGTDRLRPLLRSTAARVWGAIVGACVVAQLAWIAFAQGLNLSVPFDFKPTLSTDELWRQTVGRMGQFYFEMLGDLGWLDTKLPGLSYLLLTAALGTVVLLAVGIGTRRYVVAMFVVIATTVVTPILLEVWQYHDYGLYWQGRYTLPIAVGVPLLAVLALQSDPGKRTFSRGWFVPAVGGMLVVAHVVAFYQALRRWSVGANGAVLYWLDPKWTSIVPQFLLILAYAIAYIALIVWLLGGRADAPATAETLTAA
jgi:hypothetical protein